MKNKIVNRIFDGIAYLIFLIIEYKEGIMKTITIMLIIMTSYIIGQKQNKHLTNKIIKVTMEKDSINNIRKTEIQNAYVSGYKMAIENNCKVLRIEADTIELNKEQFLLLIGNMDSYKQRKEKRVIYIKWDGE
jgi:hypothetical protein